jgi:fructose-1,6-bisphosphatase
LTFTAKKIGTFNAFGDEQSDADIKAEEICVNHFQKTEIIRAYMSKESPNVIHPVS